MELKALVSESQVFVGNHNCYRVGKNNIPGVVYSLTGQSCPSRMHEFHTVYSSIGRSICLNVSINMKTAKNKNDCAVSFATNIRNVLIIQTMNIN